MVKGLNRVLLIGWLDGPVETRYTPNGRSVATFTLAVPRTWTAGDGEQVEETEWFNIVVWGSLAETCADELADGSQTYVEGRLQTRKWEDNSGRKHFRTEVVAQEIINLANNPL